MPDPMLDQGTSSPPMQPRRFRRIIAATAAARSASIRRTSFACCAPNDCRARRPPVVNRSYDWRLGTWMWPALLQTLPPLPPDLQYRIVDDDLVLIDLRASLVVDILEDAMDVDED